jgi:histone-lysine N-methyltransferase ASH1L
VNSFFGSTEETDVTKEADFSKSEASLVDSETRTPRSVLMRERAERVKAKKEKERAEMAERIRKDDKKASRRSSRVALLDKASSIVDVATSVLGKRSRDVIDMGKGKLEELRRRASLRPRRDSEALPSFEGPVAKRLRLEGSESTEPAETKKTVAHKSVPGRPKTKKWLSAGLYVGQYRGFDPRLTDSKNKIKNADRIGLKERKILPLPMFAGERLLERGRDFKLPFDIFSPLPPGQPKPDEWRKTNKSTPDPFPHLRMIRQLTLVQTSS